MNLNVDATSLDLQFHHLQIPVRSLRLQKAQAHPNWTVEDLNNVTSIDESQFLLEHANVKVRIWHQLHESMEPTCLVSTFPAGGGVMVWAIQCAFQSHIMHLNSKEACMKKMSQSF